MSISSPNQQFNVTWPYIAGFIDCDGWITHTKAASHNGIDYYRIDIGLTQSVDRKEGMKAIADFMRDQGISVKWIIRDKNWKSTKSMVNIQTGELDSVIKILENVVPYMVLKRDLAVDMLRRGRKRREMQLKYRPTQDDVDLPEPSGKRFWTNEEVEILKRMNAAGYNNVAIARELRRTVDSVTKKKSRLQIRTPNRDYSYLDEQ